MSVDKFSGLPAFVRSVEAGSFTVAAQSLGTTTSAVSKSVARLEKRLGVTLFQRSTRASVLTIEGQAFYERVAPLMRGLEGAEEVLRSPATAAGRLRVSLPGELGRFLLDPVTRKLLPNHPELALDVSVGDHHADPIRDRIDIAIRAGWLEDSGLHALPITSLRLVLVAAPAYLRERGSPRVAADLPAHRHVRYRLNGRPYPLIFADGTSSSIDGRFDADNGEAMRVAALNGLGIAQTLEIAVRDDLAAGRLQAVLPDQTLACVPVHAIHAFGKNMPTRARIRRLRYGATLGMKYPVAPARSAIGCRRAAFESRQGGVVHFAGTRSGAPLSLSSSTINLAGFVWLALRPTVWTSLKPS